MINDATILQILFLFIVMSYIVYIYQCTYEINVNVVKSILYLSSCTHKLASEKIPDLEESGS